MKRAPLALLCLVLVLTGYIVGALALASINDLLTQRSQSAVEMMGE